MAGRQRIRLSLACATLVLAVAAAGCGSEPTSGGDAEAKQATPIVQETLLTITPVLADDDEKNNLSGAACSPGGACLLIGDEKRYARFFALQGNVLAPTEDLLFLLPDKDENGKEMKESDGEGIAFHDGHFYVTGSHSNSKKAKKQPSRHFVARFAVDPASGRPSDLGTPGKASNQLQRTNLDYLINEDPLLKPHLDEAAGETPTTENGFKTDQHGANIEGIAVANGKTYVGFRGPIGSEGALLYELPTEELFQQMQPRAKRHWLKLTGPQGGASQGVRDLAAVSGGLLILAGPEMRSERPKPELYFWDGNEKSTPRFLGAIDLDFKGDSPEAITLLEESDGYYRILVLSDGEQESQPVIIRVAKS